MSEEIKIKGKTIVYTLLAIAFFVWFFWPVEEGVTFTFEINETGDPINGDVFFDDNYFGFTEKGRIFVGPLDYLPEEFTLEGIHEGIEFELIYEFPEDYLEWGEIPLVVTEEQLELFDIEKRDAFFGIKEPHWGHMPLTYKIGWRCVERQTRLIRLGFDQITWETDSIVYFNETSEEPDIEIKCEPQEGGGENTIAEAYPYLDPSSENLIDYADINIYGQGVVCLTGYPALEVHEILHTFGFEHNPFTYSIMAPYSADYSRKCEITKIDDEYTSCLKYIYSNGEIGMCDIKNHFGDSPWIV